MSYVSIGSTRRGGIGTEAVTPREGFEPMKLGLNVMHQVPTTPVTSTEEETWEFDPVDVSAESSILPAGEEQKGALGKVLLWGGVAAGVWFFALRKPKKR